MLLQRCTHSIWWVRFNSSVTPSAVFICSMMVSNRSCACSFRSARYVHNSPVKVNVFNLAGWTSLKDIPHNCAQTIHIISADPNFEKKCNSSALCVREISLVTQPSFDCEQGINSQVQTVCSNADAVFPVLGIVFCKNERFSLSRKTHVPLWNEPRISHVRLPWAARTFRRLLSSAATDACWFDTG